jgi:ferrous iron transport protein B
MSAPRRVVVAGNPNAGKTTLFNALTGARARTGNYPGITVERRTASLALEGTSVELVDVPGTYSLTARSAEEQVAIDEILPRDGVGPDAALFVADAGALERHLYLAVQVLETGLPTLLCLNMIDEARAAGTTIDTEAITRALGVPVVAVSARTGEGLDALRKALGDLLARPDHAPQREPARPSVTLSLAPRLTAALEGVEKVVEETWPAPKGFDSSRIDARRAVLARWALLSLGDDELTNVPATIRTTVLHAERDAATSTDTPLDELLVTARYAIVDRVVSEAVARKPRGGCCCLARRHTLAISRKT